MLYFILGMGLSALVFGFIYFSVWRDKVRLDEEKQLIQQEKEIVIDFMHNMVESMAEETERIELFQRVVHAALLSTGACSGCIMQADEKKGQLKTAAMEGLFPPQHPLSQQEQERFFTRAKFIECILKSETLAVGEGLIGEVAKSQKAVFIKNAFEDPRVPHHEDPSLRLRSLIVAPILFRDRLIGVLAVANLSVGNPFTETDFSLVQSLAEHAGLAIHNSDIVTLRIEKNKLDLDLKLAKGVQRLLLPKQFSSTGALDIDACYIPEQQVGGDLYHVFELSDHQFGIVVADVSGKGISAALVMAICQTHLVHFSQHYKHPSAVLSALNREFLKMIPRDRFVTMIYGVFDTRQHQFTFARAGHEPPLLLRKNPDTGLYETETIASDGLALGMVPPVLFNAVIKERTLPFHPQDSLTLYTDGVTEALSKEEEAFSTHRLAEAVKTLQDRSAKEINQGILERLEAFSDQARWSDDRTLITVKYL